MHNWACIWLKSDAWWETTYAVEKRLHNLSIKQELTKLHLWPPAHPPKGVPKACVSRVPDLHYGFACQKCFCCHFTISEHFFMLWKKHQKTWKHPPQTITLHRGGGGHPLPNLIWEGHQQFLHYEATSVSKPLSVIWTWGNGCLCSVVHLELTVPLYCFGMLCSSQEKRMSLNSMFKTITQRKLSKFHHVPILPAEKAMEVQSHWLALSAIWWN